MATGVKYGTSIKEFGSWTVGRESLSDIQKRIIEFLKAIGFDRLQIVAPAFEGLVNPTQFPAHPHEIRLAVLGEDKKPLYDPDVLRAFVALEKKWKGGLGIGGTVPGLTIDLKEKDFPRWIDFANLRLANSDDRYRDVMRTGIAESYRYKGDGGIDWEAFERENKDWTDVLSDSLKTLRTFALITVSGLGLYFGVRALGFAENFIGKARR